MKIETELCQFIIAERVFNCYNTWSKILHDEIEKFEANIKFYEEKGYKFKIQEDIKNGN